MLVEEWYKLLFKPQSRIPKSYATNNLTRKTHVPTSSTNNFLQSFHFKRKIIGQSLMKSSDNGVFFFFFFVGGGGG